MAADWGKLPWEITGEALTPWRKYVWFRRYELVADQVSQRRQREQVKLLQQAEKHTHR